MYCYSPKLACFYAPAASATPVFIYSDRACYRVLCQDFSGARGYASGVFTEAASQGYINKRFYSCYSYPRFHWIEAFAFLSRTHQFTETASSAFFPVAYNDPAIHVPFLSPLKTPSNPSFWSFSFAGIPFLSHPLNS